MPKRIQRKRTKGWKMPPNTVYVGRPSRWGNPFRVGIDAATNEEAVAMYTRAFDDPIVGKLNRAFVKIELAGKDLACWCKEGEACHADVLLAIANNPPAPAIDDFD